MVAHCGGRGPQAPIGLTLELTGTCLLLEVWDRRPRRAGAPGAGLWQGSRAGEEHRARP